VYYKKIKPLGLCRPDKVDLNPLFKKPDVKFCYKGFASKRSGGKPHRSEKTSSGKEDRDAKIAIIAV